MEWTDKNSAIEVLKWAERSNIKARCEYTRAHTEEVGRIVMKKYWDENNPNDGVGCPSSNPYQKNHNADAHITKVNEEAVIWEKVSEFVRNRICNLIEEEKHHD